MSSVHELSEKIEHLSHGGPGGHGEPGGHGGHEGGKASGKLVGITMAILGVMLAVSSALVGAQRTLLITSMVQQSTKWGLYQAETMKFRVIEADTELLKSISPKPDEVRKIEATLRTKRAPSGKADDEDTAELKDLIASSTEDMADLLTPDPDELKRFKKLAKTYDRDMREAKEDAEAYEGAIEAHQEAAEWYEWAQLAAEVGIVVASIALLMGSQPVWLASVALGLGCAATLGITFVRTEASVRAATGKIEAAAKNVQALEADDDAAEGAEHPEKAAPEQKEKEKEQEKK